MPRFITVVTPENVKLDYELAGIASRCGAAVIDILIQIAAIAILVGVYFGLEILLRFSAISWPTAVLIVLGFLLWWGYYAFFETIWSGQTPGKRLLRLRAVKHGGTPVDVSSATIRSLIRAIDLGVFFIGVISMLVTSNTQRLGDLAAGTIVVKERSEWKGDLAQPQRISADNCAEAALVKNIELVTPDQFETIKRFLDRGTELQPDIREQLAAKISGPLMQHLGIENNGRVVHTNLLSVIYDRCVQDRGMR